MQSASATTINEYLSSRSTKTYRRLSSSGEQEQWNFAMDLWKKAFRDACEKLCPVRAGGHECGCLRLLARLVKLCTSLCSLRSTLFMGIVGKTFGFLTLFSRKVALSVLKLT